MTPAEGQEVALKIAAGTVRLDLRTEIEAEVLRLAQRASRLPDRPGRLDVGDRASWGRDGNALVRLNHFGTQ